MGNLAVDASSPAVATSTTATVTTASFTPPANSLLEIRWAGNSQPNTDPGSGPSITDNLGTPLTYTQTDWSHRGDGPAADGQAAIWTAPVVTSAPMTVSVTNNAAGVDANGNALKIRVITDDSGGVPTVGAHGKAGSASAGSIAQSYTAQATGGWGSISVCDWDLKGAETAGTGCSLDGSANVSTLITYGFVRRTTADDVNGNSNTLNVTIPATSANLRWAYVEILPAAATSPAVPPPTLPPPLLYELAYSNQQQWLAGSPTAAPFGAGDTAAHNETAATTSKGGQGASSAAAHVATTATGVKGVTNTSGTVAQRNTTTDTTRKQATGTGLAAPRDITQATTAVIPGGPGAPIAHPATTATGKAGRVGTANPAPHPVTAATSTTTSRTGTTARPTGHSVTAATGVHAAAGAARTTARVATASSGVLIPAYTPILVALDNSATGSGALSGTAAADSIDEGSATESGMVSGSAAASSVDDSSVTVSGLVG